MEINLRPLFLSAVFFTPLSAAESEETLFTQRRAEVLAHMRENPWPDPGKNIDFAAHLALLKLFHNEDLAEANRMVQDYCGADPLTTYVGKRTPKNRCEAIFRVALLPITRERLEKESLEAIEDHAWAVLTKYPIGMSRKKVDEAELAHFLLPNNGQTNLWRRHMLALEIVHKAARHGPEAMLEGQSIESHRTAWIAYWTRFFQTFPNEGTDMDIAHPTSYGSCTVGAYYDIHDLVDDPGLRRLAGNFITLFWAEVAAEFNPVTGERVGMATTRWATYTGHYSFWAQSLLYCYHWHDLKGNDRFLGNSLLFTSDYRPPAILSAIARNADRGSYLATSRRPGLIGGAGIEVTETKYRDSENYGPKIIFDENGDSHFRRDVYYTPDYALGTLTYDPRRQYVSDISLTPMMGATFGSRKEDRISVMGTGFYADRSISGITGTGVSIIARDPNAQEGRGRFMSDGTRVFVSNGALWDNRAEDESGWFFTRNENAYVAIRMTGAYEISDKTFTWPNRELKEVEEKNGHHLESKDMWAPVVIQMGRAKDYENFEAFQTSVKENKLTYENGKLTYKSEANETFEIWTKGTQLPKIRGETVNLNPENTYDSPFLSMKHGSNKAVIAYHGHKDVILDFTENP